MINTLSIQSAASSALQQLSRTSFSEDVFTSQQIDAISDAITKAIEEYDRQKQSDKS